ncbi:MAG TPA: hypothetical protein VEL11_16110, partial [Candidatus Bathyarchaeia archaeon]|nr:hypothetical protein [Candidatus Bathyarchaeia archaeon]
PVIPDTIIDNIIDNITIKVSSFDIFILTLSAVSKQETVNENRSLISRLILSHKKFFGNTHWLNCCHAR